ncbi:hypothetical protein ACPV40_00585 [Vibrio alfacsensis]|uniref:hypothetical protein n=1 Tax=Vibrio TaxID=662 RepID=UPI0016019C95|nr:hypothetical protein [Vibrio sp. PID23_8]
MGGKKKANRSKAIGLCMREQVEFTNNVSWLGDPRLKKGHYKHSSSCAFYLK